MIYSSIFAKCVRQQVNHSIVVSVQKRELNLHISKYHKQRTKEVGWGKTKG